MRDTLRRIFATTLFITWALWFGGMIALILLVSALFANDRPVALEAAPRLFLTFGLYQLFVGMVAIAAAVVWYAMDRRRIVAGILLLHALAATGALLLSTMIVPPMEKLRAEGQRESAAFRQLHKRSTTLYLAEAVALFVAGCALPIAISSTGRRDHQSADATPTADEATAPPDAAADQATAT